MIKYLGSKRSLIPWIIKVIEENCPGAASAVDLFSGTSRVGFALKEKGLKVSSNDHNLFAYYLARCYVETDVEEIPQNFDAIIAHLNQLPGKHGFFTENYCIKSRFFHPKNGEKIDAIRDEIAGIDVSDKLKSVLLVSLMEAADRVDSTCGIQMAYLKSWAPRAFLPMTMRMPRLAQKSPHGLSQAHCMDAIEAASVLEGDVCYLDPPYNQHSYRGNYHIWETLVRNDQPEVYGLAHKRADCKTNKSIFNSKPKFKDSLSQVLVRLKARYIVLSFSDEGFISQGDIENILSDLGALKTFSVDYKRYVGAQIGIYNHQGKKVGDVKKLHNKEYLYVVDRH